MAEAQLKKFRVEFEGIKQRRFAGWREVGKEEGKATNVLNALEYVVAQMCFGNSVLAMLFQTAICGQWWNVALMILAYAICFLMPLYVANIKLESLFRNVVRIEDVDKGVVNAMTELGARVKDEEEAIQASVEHDTELGENPHSSPTKLSKEIGDFNSIAPAIKAADFKKSYTKVLAIVLAFALTYSVGLGIITYCHLCPLKKVGDFLGLLKQV